MGSLTHLLTTIEQLSERGIGFESINDRVDTTSTTGTLVLHVLAAISQFERELTRERIAGGLAAARARGHKLGRKTALSPERRSAVSEMLAGGMSMAQVARITGIGRAILYRNRHLLEAELPRGSFTESPSSASDSGYQH